jgi:hypothetical protein
MENICQHKIQKYEEFVDKSLKLDLLHATAQRYGVIRKIETERNGLLFSLNRID